MCVIKSEISSDCVRTALEEENSSATNVPSELKVLRVCLARRKESRVHTMQFSNGNMAMLINRMPARSRRLAYRRSAVLLSRTRIILRRCERLDWEKIF